MYVAALLGQSNLGHLGPVVAGLGLAGLAVALGAAIYRPSWRLLWLILPLVVTHLDTQVVGGWVVGD